MDSNRSESITLSALLDSYLKFNMLALPTEARYELTARNLARFMGGETAQPSDIKLSRITPEALLGFRRWSLERMRPVSFNTERRHLSTLFNAAVRDGQMSTNPFRRVSPAPVLNRLPKAISKEDMTSYLDLLRSARSVDRRGRISDLIEPQWFWYDVLRTFYFTGMRKRQLVGLVWSDIDFNGMTIRLAAESSKTRREWKVPLPEALAGDLQDLHSRTAHAHRGDLKHRQVFCLPLFRERPTSYRHSRMTADNLDNFFQRLRRAAPPELPRLSAHRIRHTTSTILANKVPNLRLVQEQLGHSSIATTYLYVHPDLGAMRSALEALR
jgi:integrase